MGWIFSPVSADSLLHYQTGCCPKLTWKSNLSASQFSSIECSTECCQSPQYGMTCKHSQRKSCKISTLFMEASPARILALRAMVVAWQESEAGFFSRSCGWPKKSSPRSYSWKTCQQFEHGDLNKLSGNWPMQAMIVAGVVYPLRKSEHYTKETDGSCSPIFPTPTARDWKSCSKGKKKNARPLSEHIDGPLNPTWVEWLMGYPQGSTESKLWEMRLYQRKSKKHLNI